MSFEEAAWIAGVTCAEGTFTSKPYPKFNFAVRLGANDRMTCERLHRFFMVGNVHLYPKRRPHYQDEVSFSVQSMPDLINVIVPFMDEHLPPSYKRNQYLEWKGKLLDYWEHHARRVRLCTSPGCESLRRAHGLCRHHLYAAGLG